MQTVCVLLHVMSVTDITAKKHPKRYDESIKSIKVTLKNFRFAENGSRMLSQSGTDSFSMC